MPVHSAALKGEEPSCSNQLVAALTRMNCIVFKAAIEGKMDILRQTPRLEAELTPNRNTVLHIHISSGMATTDCVLAMVNLCSPLLKMKNAKDETPLHMAAKEGLTEIVRALVDQVNQVHSDHDVKEMIRMRNKDGDTALHEAVRHRRRDVVKLLIEEDREFEYRGNNAGETPLYLAVKRGFDELVDEIFASTACRSPAHGGPKGLTALHLAIIFSDAKGASGRKILEEMPNLAIKTDEEGRTPLHYAAHFDKVSLAEELLKKDESAAYIADKTGKIPLHIAASRNHIQMMEKLIAYCPDCSEVVDNRRRNVLHLAVKRRSRKAVEHILKYSWGRNLLNEKDTDGNTPLHLFAAFPSFIPTLIMSPHSHDPSVDKMAVNKSGLTAADILSSNTEAPLLKALVQLMFKISKTAPACSNVADDEDDHGVKENVSEIRKASKTHLIVAALVATVTYAAGFTLPGGYKEDKGPHRGMAVLAKKATFIAFYITDGTAMLLSTVAVVIHFFMTLQEDQAKLCRMFKLASYSTLFGMGAMLAAFAMAACSVLFTSSGALVTLAALILSLTFSLVYHVYPLLAKWVVNLARRERHPAKKLSLRPPRDIPLHNSQV